MDKFKEGEYIDRYKCNQINIQIGVKKGEQVKYKEIINLFATGFQKYKTKNKGVITLNSLFVYEQY